MQPAVRRAPASYTVTMVRRILITVAGRYNWRGRLSLWFRPWGLRSKVGPLYLLAMGLIASQRGNRRRWPEPWRREGFDSGPVRIAEMIGVRVVLELIAGVDPEPIGARAGISLCTYRATVGPDGKIVQHEYSYDRYCETVEDWLAGRERLCGQGGGSRGQGGVEEALGGP
jgi:hypothetical protein